MSYAIKTSTMPIGFLSGRVGLFIGNDDKEPAEDCGPAIARYPGASWIEVNASVMGEQWEAAIMGGAGDMPVVTRATIGKTDSGEPTVIAECEWAPWRIVDLPDEWAGVPLDQIAHSLGGFPRIVAAEVWLNVNPECALAVTPRWLSDLAAAVSWSGDPPVGTLFVAAGDAERITKAVAEAAGAWRVEVRL